jgi:hypothetical protein
LFGEYFQGVYVRDSSQEDFVVDDSVKDSSTVSLIQLEEETVEQGILALDTKKEKEKYFELSWNIYLKS